MFNTNENTRSNLVITLLERYLTGNGPSHLKEKVGCPGDCVGVVLITNRTKQQTFAASFGPHCLNNLTW